MPIPSPLAIACGAAALVVSFCVLALAWRRPRYGGIERGRPVGGRLSALLDGPTLAIGLRTLGLLFFGWCTWALVAGPDNNNNPVLGVFYVLVWVGIVPASLVFGRAARALSPVRTLHRLLSRLLGSDPRTGLVGYPEALGVWPAAVGLLAFVWQELVNPHQIELDSIRLWLVLYLAAMLIGASVFGETWLERADPFEVYSDLVARLSVWGRRDDGTLVVRSPLANLARTVPRPGLVAVVAVLFGSTAFDSYKDTVRWIGFADRFGAPVMVNTLALVGFCVLIGLSFVVGARLTAVSDGVEHASLPRRFAPAVVPIIVGYMTAHYLSYFVEQGQQTLAFLSDPMVDGSDLLGTAGLTPNLWLSFHPSFLATVKVLAVVAGHVVGVIAAHDRAMRLLPVRHQVTGQLGMLVVMVGYTAGGLYLLFGA